MTDNTIEQVWRTIDEAGRQQIHTTEEAAREALRHVAFKRKLNSLMGLTSGAATAQMCLNRPDKLLILLAQWKAGLSEPDLSGLKVTIGGSFVDREDMSLHIARRPLDTTEGDL